MQPLADFNINHIEINTNPFEFNVNYIETNTDSVEFNVNRIETNTDSVEFNTNHIETNTDSVDFNIFYISADTISIRRLSVIIRTPERFIDKYFRMKFYFNMRTPEERCIISIY